MVQFQSRYRFAIIKILIIIHREAIFKILNTQSLGGMMSCYNIRKSDITYIIECIDKGGFSRKCLGFG